MDLLYWLPSLSSSSSSSSATSNHVALTRRSGVTLNMDGLIDDCGKLCRFGLTLPIYCLVHYGRWLWEFKIWKLCCCRWSQRPLLSSMMIHHPLLSLLLSSQYKSSRTTLSMRQAAYRIRRRRRGKRKSDVEPIESIRENWILGGSNSKNLPWIGINLESSVWKWRMLASNPSPLITMDKSVQFDVRHSLPLSLSLIVAWAVYHVRATIKNQWNYIKMVSSMQ